jgi:L-ornithine N5-oxygenase
VRSPHCHEFPGGKLSNGIAADAGPSSRGEAAHSQVTDTYDVIGIGFGPANLALAIAIKEHNEVAAPANQITAVFLERKQRFGWHQGMLLDGATMQVSFLKDLATLRNPTSRFGFVPYLHDQGRLIDFINHKILFPTREEFHDYLEWAAAGVEELVEYGADVTAIRYRITHHHIAPGAAHPPPGSGPVGTLEIIAHRHGSTAEPARFGARSVVLGTGLMPLLPEGVEHSPRVFHSASLLPQLEALPSAESRRFVVVGAGQSAAEVTGYLYRRYPEAEICAVFSRYGYSLADDSPFANRIFDPAAVDAYFGADDRVKDQLMSYHRNTNYSVVDLDLLQDLYRCVYQDKVRGTQRLRMLGASQVTGVKDQPHGVTVRVLNLVDGSTAELPADAVVFATGYRSPDPAGLLGDLDRHVWRDTADRVAVARDYRLCTDEALRAPIYLQGGTDHTHGITSSLLSMAALRAGTILDSLLAWKRGTGSTAPIRETVGASHD